MLRLDHRMIWQGWARAGFFAKGGTARAAVTWLWSELIRLSTIRRMLRPVRKFLADYTTAPYRQRLDRDWYCACDHQCRQGRGGKLKTNFGAISTSLKMTGPGLSADEHQTTAGKS